MLFTYDEHNDLVSSIDLLEQEWSYTYDSQHRMTALIDPEGQESVTTEYDMSGRAWRQYDGEGNLLVKIIYNTDESITVIDADGNEETHLYDARGVLINETDSLDRDMDTLYDANFRPLTVANEAGHTLSMEWSEDGKYLLAETDPEGNRTEYTYDDEGRLLSETDPEGNTQLFTYTGDLLTSVEDAEGDIITYSYTEDGLLSQQTDSEGKTISYDYDEHGQRTSTTNWKGNTTSYTYDEIGNLVETVSPQGLITRNEYNAAGQLLRTIENYDPARGQNDEDLYNITTEYTYDINGNLITETDTYGRVTRYVYDNNGRRIRTINAAGNVTRYEYNEVGQRTAVMDANGNQTRYVYDPAGRLLYTINALGQTSETTSFNAASNTATVTDSDGNTYTYYYNEVNQVVRIVNPLGYETGTTYTSDGSVETSTDELGRTTTYEYDQLGRLIRTTSPGGAVNQSVYDSEGNRIASIDPLGNQITYTYAENNRLIHTTDPLGNQTTNVYDGHENLVEYIDVLGRSTRYEYDEWDRKIAQTDPDGDRTTYIYDILGRVVSTTSPQGTSTTTYDALGRRTAWTDEHGRQATNSFDELDRVVSSTDYEGRTTTNSYDAVGNLLSTTDSEGNTTSYTYDALNRKVSSSNALGNTSRVVYNAAGQVSDEINVNGIITHYEYDVLGRKTAVILNHRPEAEANADTNVRVEYTYNAVGNITAVKDANGNVTQFEYDSLNRLVRKTDPLGNTWVNTYDLAGNLVSKVDGNGAVTHYSYDAAGNLLLVDYPDPDADVSFTYDAAGRRTGMTDGLGTTTWTYNNDGRVLTVTDPYEHQLVYTYNDEGDCIGVEYFDGKQVGYIYDYDHFLTGVTDWDEQTTEYEYDSLGQISGVTLPNGVSSQYSLDELGRLSGLEHESDQSALAGYEYTYDALGNVIRAVENISGASFGPTVQITLADTAGEPLSAKEVYAYQGEEYSGYHRQTDENGRVSITLPEGTYRFKVIVDGTEFWSATEDHCEIGDCGYVTMTIPQAVLVSVLDTDNLPQEGLRVYAYNGEEYTQYFADTDENGQASLRLPEGEYRFRSDFDGTRFWSTEENHCTVPGCTNAEILISKPLVVSVLNDLGEPKTGLNVYAYAGDTYTGLSARTDENGEVQFTLPEGEYHFRADYNGTQFWSSSENHCALPGCTEAVVTVSLPLTVSVTDTEGNLVSNASVYVYSGGTYQRFTGKTNENGELQFTLPQGDYRFRADYNGTQFWSAGEDHCSVPGCTAASVVVTRPVLVSVLNTTGTPQVGLNVYVFSGTTYQNYNARTDENGEVRFTLPQGDYRFRADLNGTQFWSSTANDCSIPGNTTALVSVTIPVQVLVQDADGEGLANIRIYAYSGTSYSGYQKTSGSDGLAVFTLPEGDYRFRADVNGEQIFSGSTNHCSVPGCDLVSIQAAQASTNTPLPSQTKTQTLTPTPTATATAEATLTYSVTPTLVFTHTATAIQATDVQTKTPTAILTTVVPEDTPTPSLTHTEAADTPVPSFTPTPTFTATATQEGDGGQGSLLHQLASILSIPLPDSVNVEVQVEDTDGQVQAGLTVYAFDGSTYTGVSAVTSVNGKAALSLPEGNYRFRADLNGTQFWSSTENNCTIPSCSIATIFVSKPLQVSVVDTDGEARSGLNVYAFDGTTYSGYSKTTDENGQALFTLPRGDYRFRADLNGTQFWSSTANNCSLPGCESTQVVVTKPLTVTVSDSAGTPKAGLPVYAFDGETYSGYSKTTDENGQAVFTLPQGDYRFRADLNGTRFWSGSENHCTLPGCSTAAVEVALPLTLTVLDTDGTPQNGVAVYAFDGATYSNYSKTTDENGQAVFTLPQGSYRFRADLNGTQFWSSTENHCDIPGTTSLSLTLNKVLTLSVLNSNGEGMPDIHVYAFDGNTYSGYSQITDENGTAFFTLPDGDYRFRADLNGTQFWSSESNDCTLPGCESAQVTLSLPLVVTVQDTDGTPQAGLNVYAFDGQTYTNYNALTDENGQAVFSLPEGDYRFRTDLNGTQFWSSTENHCSLPGCEGVSLNVSKPVQVTVSGETGYAYEGLSVYAFSGETYSGFSGVTDAEGKLSFTLPEGDYRFRADYDGVQFWSGTENTCTLPGCEEETVVLPGGSGERRVTIDYTYDALNRLTSAVYSDGTRFEYVYDAAGNVLSALAPVGTSSSETTTTEYTYDSANQLNTAVEDGVTWYYGYDGNGSLVQTDPGGEAAGAKRYTYNTAGYLTKVETHTGSTWEGQAEMKYDGLGNRLEMNTFSGSETLTTYYQVDEGQTVAVIGPENTTYYLLGLDVLATYRDGWSYILPDGTGTSRQLVNAAGEVNLSISYTPWGDTLAIYGNGDLDLGYLGGIYDETTGLLYVGKGQYYDPHTGRFLTRGMNSQQTNPYVPWAADPSGMLFAPLALFSLVYGRRKKQAAKWEILLLVLLLGGLLALGLTACGGGPSATPTVQAPSVPVASSTPTVIGTPTGTGTPTVNGTPNESPSTECTLTLTPTNTATSATFKNGQYKWWRATNFAREHKNPQIFKTKGMEEGTERKVYESNCANFVSYALEAGGLNTTDDWRPGSEKWVNSNSLFDFLEGLGFTRSMIFESTPQQIDTNYTIPESYNNSGYLPLRMHNNSTKENYQVLSYELTWPEYLNIIQNTRSGDLIFFEDWKQCGWSHVGIISSSFHKPTSHAFNNILDKYEYFDYEENDEPSMIDHSGILSYEYLPRSIGDSDSFNNFRVVILHQP